MRDKSLFTDPSSTDSSSEGMGDDLAAAVTAASGEESSRPADGQLPERICPHCSTRTYTAGSFCPQCGGSYVGGRASKRRGLGRRGKVALGLIVVLLLAGGGVAGYLVKHHHDQQVAAKHNRKVASKREARHKAAAAASLKALQDSEERASRRSIVTSLEKSVTKDAEKDVNTGLLDGPILRTECSHTSGGGIGDLAQNSGNWSCLAVDKDNADGTSSGYEFSANIDYKAGSYTWHLGR